MHVYLLVIHNLKHCIISLKNTKTKQYNSKNKNIIYLKTAELPLYPKCQYIFFFMIKDFCRGNIKPIPLMSILISVSIELHSIINVIFDYLFFGL